MLNASLNEIYTFDAETLHFEFVSEGALRNLGYSLSVLRQMTPLDLKPEYTVETFAYLLAPLRHGEIPTVNFETVHRRADDSLYPVEVHLQIFDQAERRIFLAVTLDVTERRHTEEVTRLQSAALEAVANAIVITDCIVR